MTEAPVRAEKPTVEEPSNVGDELKQFFDRYRMPNSDLIVA